jgi:hypothetical protein
MSENPERNRIQRRRMRYAESKLREAQLRLARTERSILYWSRMLADLRYERTCAIQPPLWPEEGVPSPNRRKFREACFRSFRAQTFRFLA